MELSGALLNPRLQVELPRLVQLRKESAAREKASRLSGRALRRRQDSVLDAVTAVLERARQPLRVREVHIGVEQMLGGPIPFSSVNEALSTHAGPDQVFRRLGYGCTTSLGERLLGKGDGHSSALDSCDSVIARGRIRAAEDGRNRRWRFAARGA